MAIYIKLGIPMLVVKAIYEISKNAFAVGMPAGTKTMFSDDGHLCEYKGE